MSAGSRPSVCPYISALVAELFDIWSRKGLSELGWHLLSLLSLIMERLKMQLDVGMEPTFKFEHMICICKEMRTVKFEIL